MAFVRGLDRAVIDEVQRAPDLLLAIKQSVDEDPRPGRFLLTGCANLLTIKTVNESLAGRVEVVPLYPLGRSERLRAKAPQFISKIFRGQLPQPAESLTGDKLLQIVAAGGYPDAIKRRSERRRHDWYRAYLNSIVERDVPEIADIAAPDRIPRLLEISARFASQLTNLSEIGRSVGLDHKTVEHYLRVLEQIYLVQRLPPWSRNELSRLVKTPKLQFIDSGLLTAMRGYSVARLRSDRSLLGPILESFVFSELSKAAGWAKERVSLFHYRDKDQLEVDFILENTLGQIVGISRCGRGLPGRRDSEIPPGVREPRHRVLIQTPVWPGQWPAVQDVVGVRMGCGRGTSETARNVTTTTASTGPGQKFAPDGKVQHFPGNTVICNIPRPGAVFDELCAELCSAINRLAAIVQSIMHRRNPSGWALRTLTQPSNSTRRSSDSGPSRRRRPCNTP